MWVWSEHRMMMNLDDGKRNIGPELQCKEIQHSHTTEELWVILICRVIFFFFSTETKLKLSWNYGWPPETECDVHCLFVISINLSLWNSGSVRNCASQSWKCFCVLQGYWDLRLGYDVHHTIWCSTVQYGQNKWYIHQNCVLFSTSVLISIWIWILKSF